MSCARCGHGYDRTARYCPQCGASVAYRTASVEPRSRNAIWLYALLLAGTELWYRILQHVWIPALEKSADWKTIARLYEFSGLTEMLLKLGVSLAVVITVKSTSARIAAALAGTVSLLLFGWDNFVW